MKNGLIFVSVLLFFSMAFNVFQYVNEKNYRQEVENWTLSETDSLFIDRTVAIYDSFVRSRMGYEMSIGEAYHGFLDSYGSDALSSGDIGLLNPDSLLHFQWAYDLISNRQQNSLIELYYTNPTPDMLPEATPEWPACWVMRKTPAFINFLKEAGKANSFWNEYADAVEAAGDISSTSVIYGNENIDFTNKSERFLAIMPFMDGRWWYARPFTLETDLRRNDSLKKLLWNQ